MVCACYGAVELDLHSHDDMGAGRTEGFCRIRHGLI